MDFGNWINNSGIVLEIVGFVTYFKRAIGHMEQKGAFRQGAFNFPFSIY